MKGMEIGYLYSSPFEALMLAIIMHIISSTPRKMIIGIPIIIMERGAARIIYRSIDSWKFSEAFPFWFTHCDSSFLDNQQIRGPITPPKGKK